MQFVYSLFSILVILVTSGYYLLLTDPCPVPVRYAIGQIDGRFYYDRDDLTQVAKAAEQIWEGKINQDLFILDPNSSFTINLVYDERQQEARTEEEWRLRLNEEEIQTEKLQKNLDQKNQSYAEVQRSYQDDRTEYETRLNNYNQKVEEHNEQGGAPEEVFSELEKERKNLNKLLLSLQKQEKVLNQEVETLNNLAEELNTLVEEYNREVNKYNAIYGSREAYTQGDFDRKRINIYKFSSETELLKVLTHEFGHALGLNHVEDEKAIMFHLMDDVRDEVPPTAADLEAFKNVCSGERDSLHSFRQVAKKVLSYTNISSS